MTKSSMAALAVFTAVFAYGDLMWPLIVNTDINMMTLSSGLATLRGQFSTNFPVMMAGSLLAMVPMVVLYLFFPEAVYRRRSNDRRKIDKMAIRYQADSNTFILETKDCSYSIRISIHLYYGKRIPDSDVDFLLQLQDRGFSPNPNEAGNDRTFSLDFLQQEFSTDGKGDYRSPSIEVINGDGSAIFSGKVVDYRIYKGKYRIEGMPSLWAADSDRADTLEIRLEDRESRASVTLLYGVFEEKNIITRSVRLKTAGISF